MRRFIYTFSFFLVIVFLSISCSDKDDETIPNGGGSGSPTDSTANQIANKWIYDEMSDWYYWNDKIESQGKLNFNLDPAETNGFFDNLLYTQAKANGTNLGTKAAYDKFSWVEQHTATAKAATATDLGFDFIGRYIDNSQHLVVLIVTYVKPNTWAARNAMKRGSIITKVDGAQITKNNWFSVLYQNKQSYKLTYAKNGSDFNKNILSEKVLQRTDNYEDKPLMIDTVYTVNNKKIGYLVFNTYGTKGDANDLADNQYLMRRISAMKDKGITDLVLDLRYNGGGLVTTGVHLGSALVPNRNTNNVYESKKYNPLIQAELDGLPDGDDVKESYVRDRFRDKIKWVNKEYDEIPRLGDQLQTLCVITTGYTASCSEMTINCLKPYYKKAGKNLYVIGENSVGKNVGSWTIEPDDERIKWQIQPIIFQSFNVDGESNYFSGISPDVAVDDFTNLATGLQELGDTNETLLAAAIAKITGNNIRIAPKTTSALSITPLSQEQLERGGKRFDMIVSQPEVRELKAKSSKVLKQKN